MLTDCLNQGSLHVGTDSILVNTVVTTRLVVAEIINRDAILDEDRE
jgi:hypothetical protein